VTCFFVVVEKRHCDRYNGGSEVGFPPLLVDSESQHETNEIVSPHLEHGPG